jgi:hypothetical protein
LCTRQDVEEALKENNIVRDSNLDKKLNVLKMSILEKVDESIRKRIEHLSASPETKDRFNKINILCATRGEQIISMKDDILEVKESQKKTNQKLDEILEKLDKKYASKWVEKVIIWAGAIIGTAVIGALMSLVLK